MSRASGRLFSLRRLGALITKEVIQMRRDRITFAMVIGVPLMQLMLFGFAINSDPKGLPAALVAPTQDRFTRAMVSALETTGYYRFTHVGLTAAEAWHGHRQWLESDNSHSYDPRVAQRIRRGAAISAADYLDIRNERQRLISGARERLGDADAWLLPSVAVVLPFVKVAFVRVTFPASDAGFVVTVSCPAY